MTRMLAIPIPVHPNDKDLPISCVRLQLPGGTVAELNLPIQGQRTLQNAIDTLQIWKATIVTPDAQFEI